MPFLDRQLVYEQSFVFMSDQPVQRAILEVIKDRQQQTSGDGVVRPHDMKTGPKSRG